jgi:hypothetical protein
MPYQGGRRLTGMEAASKLGHLEIVNSPFVKSLVDQFEYPSQPADELGQDLWREFRAEASRRSRSLSRSTAHSRS